MVTVVSYKKLSNSKGKEFYSLILQGGVKVVQSKETGKMYATGKTASLATTFTEDVCKTLIGKELPGEIRKTPCKPYQWTNQRTGETIMKDYRYNYVQEDSPPNQEVFHEEEPHYIGNINSALNSEILQTLMMLVTILRENLILIG